MLRGLLVVLSSLALTAAAAQDVAPSAESGEPDLTPHQATFDLGEALSILPAELLVNGGALPATFVSVPIMPEGEVLSDEQMRRLFVTPQIRPLETLAGVSPQEWNVKAGVRIEDVRYLAGFGSPPRAGTLWSLGSAREVEHLVEVLRARHDFRVLPGADLAGISGNGEPMKIDPAKTRLADPWRGSLGQASFVTGRDHLLVQAPTPEIAAALRKTTTSLAEVPSIKAGLAGIDAAVGDGRVVQAVLLSAETADAGTSLPSLQAMTPEEAHKAMTEPQAGIPPFVSGFLAEAEIGGVVVGILSLSYTDCTLAERAARHAGEAWKGQPMRDGRTLEATIPATIASRIDGPAPGTAGPCAATVTITPASSEEGRARVYDSALQWIYARAFPLLRLERN